MEKGESETVSLAVHSLAPFGGGGCRFSTNSCVSSSANGNNRNIGSKTAVFVATVATPLACLSFIPNILPWDFHMQCFKVHSSNLGIIIMAPFHKKAAEAWGDHPFPNCIASNKVISGL